ncbi:hypothetical protein C8J57DRAFT_1622265 [Mycena rebaudengoi]|nr:hypothetical protein C8J57DRAFT_1622265 [Mycena rebaudengoi]
MVGSSHPFATSRFILDESLSAAFLSDVHCISREESIPPAHLSSSLDHPSADLARCDAEIAHLTSHRQVLQNLHDTGRSLWTPIRELYARTMKRRQWTPDPGIHRVSAEVVGFHWNPLDLQCSRGSPSPPKPKPPKPAQPISTSAKRGKPFCQARRTSLVTIPEQPKDRVTVIVLSQLDSRYFKHISGRFEWSFDCLLFKQAQAGSDPIAASSRSQFFWRNVNLERRLEAGDYIVHVRLDCRPKARKLARVRTAKAQSQSIASNFNADSVRQNTPLPVERLAGLNLSQIVKQEKAAEQEKETQAETCA